MSSGYSGSDSNGSNQNKQRTRNNSKNYNDDGCDMTVNFLNEAGPLIESNRKQKEQKSNYNGANNKTNNWDQNRSEQKNNIRKCYNCNNTGHFAADCKKNSNQNRNNYSNNSQNRNNYSNNENNYSNNQKNSTGKINVSTVGKNRLKIDPIKKKEIH